MKNECKIVRDLLPLVEEKIASRESEEFVEEHIFTCDECRAERDRIIAGRIVEICSSTDKTEKLNDLRHLKKKLNLKKFLTIAVTSLLSAAVVVFWGYFLLIGGYPAQSEDFMITTEFKYADFAYLEQEFVMHIKRIDGKPLWVRSESFLTDKDDGVVITVSEVPLPIIPKPDNFTYGYSYSDAEPSDDFDFKFIIRFKDKDIVYSMREEGLFELQDNIIDYHSN